MAKLAGRAILILLLVMAIVSGAWEWASAIQSQRGNDLLENKDWYGAMMAYQSAVRFHSRNPETHRWLARAYLRMIEGRNTETQIQLLHEAEQELDKSIAIEPGYPYYWFDLARISELLEQLRAAHEKSPLFYYRQAALIDPNNPVFLQAMGAYLLGIGKKQEGRAVIPKLLSLDTNYAIKLAEVWLQHKYDALELVQAFSGDIRGLVMLAPVLVSYQQFKAATVAGEKVIQAEPDNPDAILTYGLVNYYSGDCARLEKIMSPAFKIPAYQERALSYFAMCLYGAQKYGQAENEYLKLVAIRPDNADYRWHLASIYLAGNRRDKAKEQLVWLANQSESADSTILVRSYYELAKIYDLERDREQALKYYQLYLQLKPDDQAAQDRVKALGKSKSGDIIYSPWEMKK
jgi:cytochrome c-type biogenesis protein CcmH/NrfG